MVDEKEDFQAFLGDLCDFLSSLEEAAVSLKQRIAKLTGSVIKGCIKPAKPVSPEDPAIKWLIKRLDMVKQAHPTVWVKFQTDDKGLITGLEYSVMEEENKADIESVARWAFEKAAGR
jgi:hypothetical protein